MSKSKPKKLALILSGGGMTTSYSVGVLRAFRNIYKIEPDIIIAASGSAGTASYFVAGQDEIIDHFWMELLPSHNNIVNAFRFNNIIDLDFIVDVLMKEQASLDLTNLRSTDIQLFLPVLHARNGSLKYFSNHDDVDWYAVVKAAKAIPIAYGKSVKIRTQMYHDSFRTSKAESHIKKAVKEGATHILVVNVTRFHKRFAIIEVIWQFFTKSWKFQKAYHKIGSPRKMPKVQILSTMPSREPEASMLDIRADDIKETILLGYQDANNDPIKTFINDFKKK